MGRGDKKTRRGKIFAGSFGKARPANKPKTAPESRQEEKTGKQEKKSE